MKRPKAAFLLVSREQVLTIQHWAHKGVVARDTEQRGQCAETPGTVPLPEETHQAHEAEGTSTAVVKAKFS